MNYIRNMLKGCINDIFEWLCFKLHGDYYENIVFELKAEIESLKEELAELEEEYEEFRYENDIYYRKYAR